MSLLALLFAEEGGGTPPGNPLGFLLPMLVIFFAFYLIVIRPANRREQERQARLFNTMEKGDKVLTIAGIYGTIISVGGEKEDEVVVKVDDNTRLKMTKRSIVQNMTKEEAAAKAVQTAKDEAKKG